MAGKKKIFSILRPVLLGLVLIAIAALITRSLYFQHDDPAKDAIRRIRERGYLIALTDANSLSYFVLRGEPMGYQLEVLQSFAKYLGVPLRLIALNNIAQLYYYLDYGAGDVIALNLPASGPGKKMAHFSDPMGETRLVLVQRKASGNKKDTTVFVDKFSDFPADTLFVRQNPFLNSYYETFVKKTGKRAILKVLTDVSQEELIRRVAKGNINYALCQENVVTVYKRAFWNIDDHVLAHDLFPYGWGVNLNSDSLLQKINAWLGAYKASGELHKVYLNYFDNQRIANVLQSDFASFSGNRLSPYDKEIRACSEWIHWDWRLVASLVYEESNFIPGQTSSRSASGLMQLMPETAARFGVDSGSSSAQQIAAGVKYVGYLFRQMPEEITNPKERIYFALASYNVGIGRVLAAREKAEIYGKDKNRWNGHVDYYLLSRSEKDPYAKGDTSKQVPADYKMEGFVDDIIARYYHYKNLIPE